MSLAMTQFEREQFLADLHVGILSIAREGKGPLTVPIWYDYTPGEDIWMITGTGSLKARTLAGVSRISFCVQTETAPYKYVSVEGPYHTRSLADGEGLHMAVRYLGDEMGRAYHEGSNAGPDDEIVVCLTPERWLTVDYTKM